MVSPTLRATPNENHVALAAAILRFVNNSFVSPLILQRCSQTPEAESVSKHSSLLLTLRPAQTATHQL